VPEQRIGFWRQSWQLLDQSPVPFHFVYVGVPSCSACLLATSACTHAFAAGSGEFLPHARAPLVTTAKGVEFCLDQAAQSHRDARVGVETLRPHV
jgi:hypothetical protein